MKRLIGFLCLLGMTVLCLPVAAHAQGEVTEIHTPEDLLAVAENPEGSFILMADLDMAGIDWPCPDFSGSFDGNGHAIVNLMLRQPGATTAKAYDGNRKGYEVRCVGLFGVMRDAEVKNLRLINVRGLVQTDEPCFVGALAGAMYNSTVSDCVILGNLELRAHDRIFGVGGAVGYGCGQILRCALDVTLICTDTDKYTKDEQFLGGVYSTGFIDVVDCTVYIDGYVSEYGYVHNGGIVGMYYQYPWGYEETGRIQDNRVEGKITFFEDNDDRRAYCNPFAGESLVFYEFYKGENTSSFKRDERWEYNKELRPDMCREPVYEQVVTPPQCADYGYTTYTCTGCGYVFTDHYTLPQHSMTDWYVQQPPTVDGEGVRACDCTGCGIVLTQPIPKLEVVPTQTVPETQATQPAPTEPVQPQDDGKTQPDGLWLLWVAGGAVAAAGIVLVLTLTKRKQ